MTVLWGNQVQYIPCQLLVLTLGTVRLAKYLCCHVLTENHLPILSRFSLNMISSNFNVCTILDFCVYLLSRRCNINILGVRGKSEEWAPPVILPWQLISIFMSIYRWTSAMIRTMKAGNTCFSIVILKSIACLLKKSKKERATSLHMVYTSMLDCTKKQSSCFPYRVITYHIYSYGLCMYLYCV